MAEDQSRRLVWAAPALDAVRTFPSAIKTRIGCELTQLCIHGPSAAWSRLKALPGVLSCATVVDPKNGRPRCAFRVVCTATSAEVVVLHASEREQRRVADELPEKQLSAIRAVYNKWLLDRENDCTGAQRRIELREEGDNVFLALGFAETQAVDFLERTRLLGRLQKVFRRSGNVPAPQVVRDALTRGIDGSCQESLRGALRAASRMSGVGE